MTLTTVYKLVDHHLMIPRSLMADAIPMELVLTYPINVLVKPEVGLIATYRTETMARAYICGQHQAIYTARAKVSKIQPINVPALNGVSPETLKAFWDYKLHGAEVPEELAEPEAGKWWTPRETVWCDWLSTVRMIRPPNCPPRV